MGAGVVAVVLSLFLLQGTVSCFKMRIYPRHELRRTTDRVKVMCIADEPLTSCEFRSYYKSYYNLNSGPLTTPTVNYRYYGNGLENGECGIDLAPYQRASHDIVECRVRTESHGWRYASTLIEVNNDEPKPIYEVRPPHAHVVQGTNVTVLGHSDGAISSCSYKWMEEGWSHFDQSSHLELAEEERNLGKGLANGDCAVILPRVETSGFIIFLAFRASGPRDTAMSHMTVFVYNPPDEPVLTVSSETYKDGDLLEATCEIANSRPVSNITWYFGDVMIRNDTLNDDDDHNTAWKWSYELHSIKQRVTRKLTWEDDGKELVCRAGHLALVGGQQDVKKTIRVLYAPRHVSRPLEVSGFLIGQDGYIKCRYYANPQPYISWMFEEKSPEFVVNGVAIDGAVKRGRFNWTEVVKVNNYWQSTLTIYNLSIMDDAEGLHVAVSNSQGGQIHFMRLDIRFVDYGMTVNDYDYGDHDFLPGLFEPEVESVEITTTTIAPSTTAKTATEMPATTSETQTTTTAATTTTPISTSPTTTSPISTTSISTTSTSTTSVSTAATSTAATYTTTNTTTATPSVATSTETALSLEEPSGTGRTVGLTLGILCLIAVVAGISFFVYRRSTRACMTGLPYANFRRSRVNDDEECFNIHRENS